LHQIEPDKKKQIKLLKKCFEKLECNNIFLITASEKQFDNSFLNQNNKTLDVFDRSRFIFQNEILEAGLNIESYDEEVFYLHYNSEVYKQMLKDRYISSLQILSEGEIDNLISLVTTDMKIPDYYTYINITK
jgi:hypothetical protein